MIESCGVLGTLEFEITNTQDARELQQRILGRQWTCESVVVAFRKRAALAQQLKGCLKNYCSTEPSHMQSRLMSTMRAVGKPVGPFHGIPLSLKDSHAIKAVNTTLEWVRLIGKPVAEDDVSVQFYRPRGRSSLARQTYHTLCRCRTRTTMSLDNQSAG